MSRKKKRAEVIESMDFIHNKWFVWLILLLVAFVIIFFQNSNISFQQGHHGFLSSHGISIAKNISLENNLLMFEKMSIDTAGNQIFSTYSRFPITSFLILKMAMSLFADNLELQIMAARYTMILFYVGSMFLAYLSLQMLLKEKILAISIVLISFSSLFVQYYNDMIFNDTPTLFGLLLVFHGIVVYNNDKNMYLQLLVKSLIGVSLGWQTYSLILLYIIYSFFVHIRSKKEENGKYFFTANYFKLGLYTFIFGVSILSFQLYTESRMTNLPLDKISTVKSMKERMGANSDFNKRYAKVLTVKKIVETQFDRIKIICTPGFIFLHYKNYMSNFFILLMLMFIVSILAQYKKYKNEYNILIIFALSGFIWGFGMNHFTMFHDFQSIYYMGIPILIYGSIFSFIYNKLQNKNIILMVIFALATIIFLNSTYTFNQIKNQRSSRINFVTADMQIIKDKVGEKSKICVDGNVHKVCGGHHACAFYLSGNYLQKNVQQAGCDFVLSNNKRYSDKLLSPKNRGVFLFDY